MFASYCICFRAIPHSPSALVASLILCPQHAAGSYLGTWKVLSHLFRASTKERAQTRSFRPSGICRRSPSTCSKWRLFEAVHILAPTISRHLLYRDFDGAADNVPPCASHNSYRTQGLLLQTNRSSPAREEDASTMNTRPAIESSSNPVALSASFNQDASCFSVGLDTGFCSMPNSFELYNQTLIPC